MPSGGARARSGPAPDPNALRRSRPDDAAGWTILPVDGRPGDPPLWPLSRPTAREKSLWGTYWAKPQAIIWERDRIVEYVALFVRQFIEAELRKSSAENRKTVRMMAADLYLTPDSLARARLKIGPVDVDAAPVASVSPITASRKRFKVVASDDPA